MKLHKIVRYPKDKKTEDLVIKQFPVHYIESDEEVSSGFERGKIERVTFELKNGQSIIYEKDK